MVPPTTDPPSTARPTTPRARSVPRPRQDGGPARGGRPRDDALTARFLAVAVDLLAEGGMALLTIEQVASRTRSGRAAVYRRWPDVHHLAADALLSRTLVPTTPATGSLVSDLTALMHPWTRELDRDERAAASLIGEARTSPAVHTALDQAVRWPLTAALAHVVGSDRARDRALPAGHERSADRVLRALWWSRYIDEPAPLRGREVVALVERVFLPLLRPC